MRRGRFGGFLLVSGAVVGAAAVVGLMFGFEPSRLPPALLDIAAYKLAFLAAGGLLAAGAIIRRRANRGKTDSPTTPPAAGDAPPEAPMLPEARESDRVGAQPPRAGVPRHDER